MIVRPARAAAAALALSLCTFAAIGAGPAHAEIPAPAKAEIDHLVAYVGNSGCEFYRNGSWYDGKKGASHISEKLNWLLNRDMIQATSDFIDKAATQSSMSGQAYKVRCNGVETASAKWLRDELARFRTTARESVAKAPVKVTNITAPATTAAVVKIN